MRPGFIIKVDQDDIRGSLERLSDAVSSVVRLPEVASQDWCSRASRSLRQTLELKACGVALARSVDGRPAGLLTVGVSASPDPPWNQLERDLLSELSSASGSTWQRALGARLMPPEHGGNGSSLEAPVIQLQLDGEPIIGDAHLAHIHHEHGSYFVLVVGIWASRDASDFGRLVFGTLAHTITKRAGSIRWPSSEHRHAALTDRENQVIRLLVTGKTVREAATELGLSPNTVHDHVKSIHRKLGVSTRGQLIMHYLGRTDDE